MIKSEETKFNKNGEILNAQKGIILLNTCMMCQNKFKPTKSMIDEILCNVCSERK